LLKNPNESSPPAGSTTYYKSVKSAVKSSKKSGLPSGEKSILKSRIKQIDDSIISSKQKPAKFKPVLKSKSSINSTPFVQ